jgi:hypothetical protein
MSPGAAAVAGAVMSSRGAALWALAFSPAHAVAHGESDRREMGRCWHAAHFEGQRRICSRANVATNVSADFEIS